MGYQDTSVQTYATSKSLTDKGARNVPRLSNAANAMCRMPVTRQRAFPRQGMHVPFLRNESNSERIRSFCKCQIVLLSSQMVGHPAEARRIAVLNKYTSSGEMLGWSAAANITTQRRRGVGGKGLRLNAACCLPGRNIGANGRKVESLLHHLCQYRTK